MEVKPADDDAWLTASGDQASRYWSRYGLVLVTNTRDFVLLGEDAAGRPARLETFRLARTQEEFESRLETPRAFARDVGAGLGEYLCRALSHRASLTEPRDLAWLLASYARDGLARVEAAGDAPSLAAVRSALEEALGVRFEGERGAAFFRSTLVQTLFYGIFSAWVLWARQTPAPTGRFNWHEAVWHLRAPVLRALFQQLSDPGRLQPLGLVEVLDWTSAALDRVERGAFFDRFSEGEAVPYFYEPFLEAFDPALRKQLGVWYTPVEVVRYMVARVDRALKDDLGIADGLAAENVYVLDPCCGTGAYLSEVLRRIAVNLEGRGLGALTGARVKQAATERVFGFEIMPAPFVVAHLQVGLTMQDLDAPLSEDADERAGVFLTNALTGWEPKERRTVPFPELEEERDRAERVKQETPVLVILGNPPYNRYPGVGMSEERELTLAYRATRQVALFEKKALNDLYVRFFRMAERRIAEKTGRGVICFISNYSWLDGLAFAGMRERYLEAFDAIRIDCLNGDKYRTGKTTPDGLPDPSIFSTREDPVGIQVGTAITTLVRKRRHSPAERVGFRHLWGQAKREELKATAEAEAKVLYDSLDPSLPLGLPFVPMVVSEDWQDWPALPTLFSTFFSGANTNRDPFLVGIDLDRLHGRLSDYFNKALSHDEIARRYPLIMKPLEYFDGIATREALLRRGGPTRTGFIRFTYRPFDTRWLYWEADTKLLNDKRADYLSHVSDDNMWLSAAKHLRKGAAEPQACFARHLSSLHLIERGAAMFPAWLRDDGLEAYVSGGKRRPNLSLAAERYLDRLGAGCGGPVPPRARRAARSRVPRGERRGAADGVAAHPASGLARRRRGRGGGRLRRVGRSGPGAGRAARLGHAGTGRHDGRAAAPGRRGRRAVDHGRRQHGRRRLRADGGLGPLRAGRGRHAGAGPRRRAPVHRGRARRAGRSRPHARRHDVRRPPQRPRLLAQRPRRRLELQARRLPGAEEVAVVPRAVRPGQGTEAGGSAALHGHGAAGRGDIGAGARQVIIVRRLLRPVRSAVGWDGFWWIAGMVAVLAIGVLLSWCFWDELRGDQDSLSTTIRNVALVVGGVGATLLAIWRSRVAERQAATAQRGLLNERYQTGAEMLGSDVLSVRLGGIYALEHLSDEHPQQYHVQVMKLFCAFVRNPKEDESYPRMPAEKNADPKPSAFLREDVQAVMDWIGSRGEAQIAIEKTRSSSWT